MNRAHKTLCPIEASASVGVVTVSESRIKYVESDNNEYIFFTTSIFYSNGTYFLDAPRKQPETAVSQRS